MTYPPQQPGPQGSYGPRPGGFPGRFGQPGPQGRPGTAYGPPPAGGCAQPGHGQPQPGFGAPNHGGGFGYGQPGGQPPRKRTGLIVGIVLGAVVVLGAGGTGLYFLLNGDGSAGGVSGGGGGGASSQDPSTPQGTANMLVVRLNAKDLAGVQSLTCAKDRDQVKTVVQSDDPRFATDTSPEIKQMGVTYRVDGVHTTGADTATAAVTETFSNMPAAAKKIVPSGHFGANVPLRKSGATWQLCGTLTVSNPGGADPNGGSGN